jgi:macrolide transport system ATP-binding/permease protein
MLISETFRIALSSIRSNLFRATLTMLGIIIGVGAVITMVALGTGAQSWPSNRLSGSATVWLATSRRSPLTTRPL